jgi:hypothetical protein
VGAAPKTSLKGAAIRDRSERGPIEKCDKSGGKVKIIACIEDPAVIEKFLKHLGLDESSQARNRSPLKEGFSHSTRLF